MARIHFVVNTTGLTGGIRVIFEYANRLQERGHQVAIIYPYDLTGEGGWKPWAKRVKFALRPRVKWFDLKVPIIRVPTLADRYIPPADIVIATANETAEWVAKLNETKGDKFYFIQGFEDWSRPAEQVVNTWKLPLKKIVIASWMVTLAKELGVEVVACITNGVDVQHFHCRQRAKNEPVKILLIAHPLPLKGTLDALAAFQQIKEQGPTFSLTIVTSYASLPFALPSYAQLHQSNGRDMASLYCKHDIFVSPSRKEGCQLPPMEAMAAGCAVVATNVGGIPDYAIAGETALVVEPDQPEQLAKAITQLLTDPVKRAKIAQAGNKHIQQFTWEQATDQFEQAIK